MLCLAFARSDFEGAFEQFRIAIENDPISSYVHSCFALVLTTAGKFKEAIPSGEYAVKLDPDSLIARYNLGYCYLWSGQLEKALKECTIGLKISNQHAWILHLISLAYLKLNQREEALKIFKEMEIRYRDHYLPPSNLAIVAAALGKDKYGLELAQAGLDIVDPYLFFTVTTLRDSEDLRNIPGFDKIKKQLGFSDQ